MNAVIVYWSMTGNTQSIAEAIKKDLNCDLFFVNDCSCDEILKYDTIILGCPAMGSESLEEDSFKPFNDKLLSMISSQRIFLFGSYDWGDGEWMRNWVEEVKGYGGNLIGKPLIVNWDISNANMQDYNYFISQIKQ